MQTSNLGFPRLRVIGSAPRARTRSIDGRSPGAAQTKPRTMGAAQTKPQPALALVEQSGQLVRRASPPRLVHNPSTHMKEDRPWYAPLPHSFADHEHMLDNLTEFRLQDMLRIESLAAAASLKQYLAAMDRQLLTVESLTSGMIAKTLTDIPRDGKALYGGFVVYDDDAKRIFISLPRGSLAYTGRAATALAIGGLDHSRASVSLAVSGDAMPTRDRLDELGNVYLSVAMRMEPSHERASVEAHTSDNPESVRPRYRSETCMLKLSTEPKLSRLFEQWRAGYADGAYPSALLTSLVADCIRLRTTAIALDFCKKSVERALASHVAWLPVSLLPEDHLSLPSLPVWIALADTDRAALYAESLPGEDRTGEAAADYMRLRTHIEQTHASTIAWANDSPIQPRPLNASWTSLRLLPESPLEA